MPDHFTTRQAAEAGYSYHALLKHVKAGRVARDRRGVYRLVHFPEGDREDLAVIWLWSDRAGVFSHQTARQRLVFDCFLARVPPCSETARTQA